MDATLVVIGVNHRTAPVAIRERFWINESRRYEALVDLGDAEGIEEIVVLATWNRTEFILWSNDAAAAVNSVLRFLTREYGLKSTEWQDFYRLLDHAALIHLFRVASGLDSVVIGEPDIAGQLHAAWQQSRKVGTSGRLLDAIFQKSLSVSRVVRKDTAIGSVAVSIPMAAIDAAGDIFADLKDRKAVIMGSGPMAEVAVRTLADRGVTRIVVVNRTTEQSAKLAEVGGGTVVTFEQRWEHLNNADIVICSTTCPHLILTRDEVARVLSARRAPICLIDLAVPRDIDPAVRALNGVFLYDIDDLVGMAGRDSALQRPVIGEAEAIIATEAAEFRPTLAAERVLPTIIALRHRLDGIGHTELERFERESGPFGEFQDQLLQELASRITQRIAGTLVRELKGLTEKVEEEQMTAAIQRLFQLEQARAAIARAQN